MNNTGKPVMQEFTLTATVGVSATTRVKATTLEEAIKVAESRMVRLSRGNGDQGYNEAWIIDTADGLPTDINEE